MSVSKNPNYSEETAHQYQNYISFDGFMGCSEWSQDKDEQLYIVTLSHFNSNPKHSIFIIDHSIM